MIKLIIFDLCGVVFHCEEPPFFRYFAKEHALNINDVEEIFSQHMKKAELGDISAVDAMQLFLTEFNVNAKPDEMLNKLSSFKAINNQTLDLVKKLKASKLRYKLAYLTNSSIQLMELSEKRLPIEHYFDFGVISAEIKARKPDKKGFALILERFSAKPEETIFIDDAQKNLGNAKEFGIRTILFIDVKQLIDELKELSVEL